MTELSKIFQECGQHALGSVTWELIIPTLPTFIDNYHSPANDQ